ncbi:hypothetical protein [Mucilaginibacter lappiensis]|uniref:Uncharacterized protein n=1 Tax=Mucilaginibacter lappiensis TaxID=354630 RepID=A0A1N7EYV8_9SPHI|nr:hypothetical protein [Mucilaginibacter lappiensis]MBB6112173.1 hypothetical protein [Mucilaginibacter lappiensis]MBB6130717.1 hypothetical protein [Mucilaginibacter lappiensis]SIR93254.1 hypothetical protein SAMN05421821_1166 [Mucilaginibacter lappiensis]
MITAHLTDAEIQLYVAEPEMTSDQLKIHIQDCANCQTRAVNYQLLFNGIQDQAKPRFDFDLTSLVLEQLPEPKRAFPWAAVLVSVFSIILIALLAVFFWSYMEAVITGASTVLIAITVTAAVVILIFQALEMVKNHQKQIHTLLNAKTLQL